MGRENWMFVRAYGPAIMVLVVAVLVKVVVARMEASPLAGDLIELMHWLPTAIFGCALLVAGPPSYRLLRWMRGQVPVCIACHGPLGGEQEGRANRGGAFRRCYACGKAVNHRHYD